MAIKNVTAFDVLTFNYIITISKLYQISVIHDTVTGALERFIRAYYVKLIVTYYCPYQLVSLCAFPTASLQCSLSSPPHEETAAVPQ